MNWQSLISAFFAAIGPILSEWLKKWLEGKLSVAGAAFTSAPAAYADPSRAYAALFDSAISDTPRLAFARRSLLRRLKAVAVARAGDFASQPVVALTQTEVDDIRDAAGAAENE